MLYEKTIAGEYVVLVEGKGIGDSRLRRRFGGEVSDEEGKGKERGC